MSDFHMPVELILFEISTSNNLAESRRKANREAGIVDRMIGFRDPLEIEIDGVLGEFAVCKYLNVYPDLTTEIRAGGHDCVYMGLTCDVKTRPYSNNPSLQVPEHKKKGDTEIFILVEVEKTQTHILGFATREDVFRPENLKPSVRKGRFHYELPWAQLTPIGDLHAYAISQSEVA